LQPATPESVSGIRDPVAESTHLSERLPATTTRTVESMLASTAKLPKLLVKPKGCRLESMPSDAAVMKTGHPTA